MNLNNAIAGAVVLLCGGLLVAGMYLSEPEAAPAQPTLSDFPDADTRANIVAQADGAVEGLELPIDVSSIDPGVIRDRVRRERFWVQYSGSGHTVTVSIEGDSVAVFADGKELGVK